MRGIKALRSWSKVFQSIFTNENGITVSYTVLRKNELFTKENHGNYFYDESMNITYICQIRPGG